MSEPSSSTGAPIVMPKLGLTMSEGLIAQWCVKPGDAVSAGQILFIVETDKISNEIEAPADGTILALLAEEGSTVDVGAVVATWTGPAQGGGADVAATSAAAGAQPAIEAVPSPPPAALRSLNGGRRLSTPFARRLAQQGGVDIATVSGSGPRGRIKARDVQAVLASRDLKPATSSPSTSGGRGRNLRSLIAARVLRSKSEIPHFYVDADARFDALAALRRDLNADPLSPHKLSVTALLGAAVVRALTLRPDANVVWRNHEAVPLQRTAVGIAVETPGGVMAPVVPFEGGVHDFAAALDGAIERVRQGRLGQADTGEAAIGISNVGMFGVRALTPIIDPDQSFMLGVGAPHMIFLPDGRGMPVAEKVVTLSLACDHRAIDGAAAARFLATIVDLIEHPARLLLERR